MENIFISFQAEMLALINYEKNMQQLYIRIWRYQGLFVRKSKQFRRFFLFTRKSLLMKIFAITKSKLYIQLR